VSDNPSAFDDDDLEKLKIKAAQLDLRSKEVDLRLKSADLNSKTTSLWKIILTNPIIIGAVLTAYVGITTAAVTFITAQHQIALDTHKFEMDTKLELNKIEGQLRLERLKNESSLILEVIKTGDPTQVAANLKLLYEMHLIDDPEGNFQRYLANREPKTGVSLGRVPDGKSRP
jgi:hypothetical protein